MEISASGGRARQRMENGQISPTSRVHAYRRRRDEPPHDLRLGRDYPARGDVAAIGSGGGYALAAARVLLKHTKMPADEVAKEALLTAAGICVYTNTNVTVETVGE